MDHENFEREINLPPGWCSGICTNSMNEFCINRCALGREAEYFKEKPDLKLEDLPKFPTKDLTRLEKLESVVIYLGKIIDHLQGV